MIKLSRLLVAAAFPALFPALAAAADLAQAVRSNEPQVIDLGSLPPDAEGPPEGSEPPSDSWWWRFIHMFK